MDGGPKPGNPKPGRFQDNRQPFSDKLRLAPSPDVRKRSR